MSRLQNKSVLITGASSGIGAFLAHELAQRGARVGLLARREDRLRELADEIREKHGKSEEEVAWAVADVTDADQLWAALDQVAGQLGGADVVVANAGFGRAEPPHKFKPGRALNTYDVNLFGMLRTFDWALPNMIERRAGQLVGVASVASFIGFTDSAAYCGSKAAMRVHMQSLRLSLKPYNVAVTSICPGFVKSELTDINKGAMPFMWETDRAARLIADAIEKRRGEVVFPWQMKLGIAIATRLLPTPLLERFLQRKKAPKPASA